jgi:prepilin-type N-terminal cleavage/methylation domain-containing protein
MGDYQMRKGFSLIEVLVALFITMIIFMSVIKISVLSLRSNSYSESITYASILGHMKLGSLKHQSFDSAELKPQWHRDSLNPISYETKQFYRFWSVYDVSAGKKVILYTAWVDGERGINGGAVTMEDIQNGHCPNISFSDIFIKD